MKNVIGGDTAGARNIISGNGHSGISIDQSPGNVVQGNYIGTDVTGTAKIGNPIGVLIERARETVIGGESAGAGNLISGNEASGITIFASLNDKVQGNFIGTNNDGTAALGNGFAGVSIEDVADAFGNHLIGGSSAAARNLISGNEFGISVHHVGGNAVQGNYIGTDMTGEIALGNTASGVLVEGTGNVIGGESAGTGNVISGNDGDGVLIFGSSYTNKVEGNLIGTNPSGTAGVGKQRNGVEISAFGSAFVGNNQVGGTSAGARNLISRNEIGVLTQDSGGNTIQGNYIGTDISGSQQLHNGTGVVLGSVGNTVGGTAPGAGNVISGNGAYGVSIEQFIGNPSSNLIQGNYIGTDPTGTSSVGNGRGIGIGGASNNLIGGSTGEARNVISGNGAGINLFQGSGNAIKGNYIGVDASGEVRLDNSFEGISVDQSSQNNTIGGTDAADRNVISANQWGVWIRGFSSGNLVAGNYIGTNASGTAVMGNRTGIIIGEFAENNTIGGDEPGAGNVISGSLDGVDIEGAKGNVLQGNYIGTDPSGTADWGNEVGVSIDQSDNNIIGGVVPGSGNTIAHNTENGVDVFGLASIGISVGNTIRGNSIYSNGGKGISNTPQQNEELPPPVINSAGSAAGTACADCTIDVYSDDEDEGRIYHGSTVADASGNWSFSGAVVGPNVTATATDANGTTSEFSAPFTCLDEDGDGVCNSGDRTPLGECAGMAVTILGSDGPDSLVGTQAADVIDGAGGDDFIQGRDGDDVICGGSGDDLIEGQDGRDAIYGEGGNDRLKGDKGADLLDGGIGSDRCYGGEGRDAALNCEKRSSIP